MLKTTPQNSSLARFVELKAHSPIEGLLTQHVPWLGPAAAEGASGDVRPHLCIRRTRLIPRGTGLPLSVDSYSPGRCRVLWDTIFNASHPQWKMGKKRRCSILSNGFYLVLEIRTGRGAAGGEKVTSVALGRGGASLLCVLETALQLCWLNRTGPAGAGGRDAPSPAAVGGTLWW